jgi:hypothetical protein
MVVRKGETSKRREWKGKNNNEKKKKEKSILVLKIFLCIKIYYIIK